MLVRVQASAANPADNAIAAGMLNGMFEHDFPVILGRDYAGVVEQVGTEVTRYAAGDEVYGFLVTNPTVHDGAWAELIAVPEDTSIARKPNGVDLATAGAAPLAAITAMTAIDALEPSAGDAVLVVGATGGVGNFAVQLAAHAGATVIAPALAEDEDYLSGLGVSGAVRPQHRRGGRRPGPSPRWRRRPARRRLLHRRCVRPARGCAEGRRPRRLHNSAAGDAPGRTNVMAIPSPANLGRLAQLLEARTLEVPIQHTYELDRAGEALQALATTPPKASSPSKSRKQTEVHVGRRDASTARAGQSAAPPMGAGVSAHAPVSVVSDEARSSELGGTRARLAWPERSIRAAARHWRTSSARGACARPR